MTSAEAPARKIVANFFVSLDGVVESPDKWHFPYFDDEMGAIVGEGFATSDALLMGGTLYREWAAYWPTSDDAETAAIMNDIQKYVVSDSLETADWTNATLLRRDEAAERIRELKAQPGKNIAMSGSATLVAWLLREGLLDELQLLVHPIAVGKGQRLFEADAPQPLELVSSRTLGTGVLHLVYRPAQG